MFVTDTSKGRTLRCALAAAAIAVAWPALAQDAPQGEAPAAEQPAAEGQPPAQGQQGAAGQQPDWVKLCSQNPQNNQQVCVVTRERRAVTGQLLAAVSVREIADKKVLVTAVPPGMLLRPGLQVQIDGANATKVDYTICFPNLCFAEAEIKPDYINAMKRGSTLIVTTLNQQAKPVNFDISLAGFTKSYDGEAIDPQRLQAEQQRLQDELRRKAEETRRQLIERQQQSGSQ
jgi:invasion protein IalB